MEDDESVKATDANGNILWSDAEGVPIPFSYIGTTL